MRSIAIGILALAGAAIAAPAVAQDVYVGAGPVGVGVDVDRDHHRDWRHHYAYDDDAVVVHRGDHRHCRTTVVHRYGETKKIRRCW